MPGPAWWSYVTVLLAYVVIANAAYWLDPASVGLEGVRTPLLHVLVGFSLLYTVASMTALIFQTVRQILIVSRLHRGATNIDLFQLRPAHAFGTLTARAGMGLALFIAFNVVLREATRDGAPVYAMVVAGILAIAVSTLPLLGMQARLRAEKARMLSRTDAAIKTTVARIHALVDADDHGDVGGLNTSLNTLLTSRKVVAGLSTWPWETDTVRGFASTLLLPILLSLTTRLLGRLV